jgi:hypothetical protein
MSIWNQMRTARAQNAIESVLLKYFDKPCETLERKIVQSSDFRASILKFWARHAVNSRRAYTEESFSELLKLKV